MALTNLNHIAGYSVTQTRFITGTDLFGTCAAWMFIGFIFVQAFTYFRHFKKDSKFLKAIVYIAILLQILETGTESYEAYAINSAGWGDPEIFYNLTVGILGGLQPICVTFTAFIVQCFFIWRIRMFSASSILHTKIRMFLRFVCATLVLVSALSLGAGLTIGFQALTSEDVPRWYDVMISLWFGSSAVVDITITVCMMALLHHAKTGSFFSETRDLLSRLIQIVLQTGLLTSVLALLALSLRLGVHNAIYSLPWYILGKSEVISLLANLIARKRSSVPVILGSENTQVVPLTTKMTSIAFSPPDRRLGAGEIDDSLGVSHRIISLQRTSIQFRSVMRAENLEKNGQDAAKPSNRRQSNAV